MYFKSSHLVAGGLEGGMPNSHHRKYDLGLRATRQRIRHLLRFEETCLQGDGANAEKLSDAVQPCVFDVNVWAESFFMQKPTARDPGEGPCRLVRSG